jgi:GTP-binding protein
MVRDRLPFAAYSEMLRASALTGTGVRRVLKAAERAADNRRRRITTGELNRVLGRALRDSPPQTIRGMRLRVYYVAQTAISPPTFTLVCNREEELHFSESRRIENIIRRAADFTGTPIRVSVRGRSTGKGRGRKSRAKKRK